MHMMMKEGKGGNACNHLSGYERAPGYIAMYSSHVYINAVNVPYISGSHDLEAVSTLLLDSFMASRPRAGLRLRAKHSPSSSRSA